MNLDDLNTLHTLDELESRNDLTDRPNLERLHVLDDLQELDGDNACVIYGGVYFRQGDFRGDRASRRHTRRGTDGA